MKFLVKGGPAYCFIMAGRYAKEAFSDIKTSIDGNPIEAPAPPVSCASLLAQKMGLSEQQTVMAAGFAGGIGLSGGGCGALGLAIWKISMEIGEIKMDGFSIKNPDAQAAIDRFLEITDYEFECSEIVGREFEDIHDHAEYIRSGGCSEIIKALAE